MKNKKAFPGHQESSLKKCLRVVNKNVGFRGSDRLKFLSEISLGNSLKWGQVTIIKSMQ